MCKTFETDEDKNQRQYIKICKTKKISATSNWLKHGDAEIHSKKLDIYLLNLQAEHNKWSQEKKNANANIHVHTPYCGSELSVKRIGNVQNDILI